jgi:hypothetical protein
LTASARNSGEYNPFGSRSIFILQIVNYTIRRTPLFPAYLRPSSDHRRFLRLYSFFLRRTP